jgi:nucleoside-diphosphate-sugar epimerase
MDREPTPWQDRKFFVTGANGQLGRMLVKQLCKEVGKERVFATDLGDAKFDFPCRYETLDVTDGDRFKRLVEESKSDTILHLAAILSAVGEKNPQRALDVNVKSTISAVNIANDNYCRLLFPSTIATFGGNAF